MILDYNIKEIATIDLLTKYENALLKDNSNLANILRDEIIQRCQSMRAKFMLGQRSRFHRHLMNQN